MKPLRIIAPFLARYPGHLAGAVIALLGATAATLALPLALRRVIDHGFNAADRAFIDRYFLMLLAVAGLLAIASAGRYYFVSWLGERVVADLRVAVFRHVTRLSAAFFDRTLSGEIVSRLTADAAQIKTAVGSSV
ncbi:ABC transporter transmembrane domain-containing protein, partial [Pseudoxanthobacter sp.]|uniref:ABC transporter transmembrane domain-containing protein n=1 Tax=Pseudoxanthobacter sp. TaxID=1925742 RepID=UPI002FE07168